LQKATEDLARTREHLRGLEGQLEELESKLQALQRDEEDARGQIAHGQTDQKAREERIGQISTEIKVLAENLEKVGSEVTSLRVRTAENAQRAESWRRELEDSARQRGELLDRTGRLKEALSQSEAKLFELEQSIARTQAEHGKRLEDLGLQTEALELFKNRYTQKQAEIRDQETKLRELRTRMDELTQGVSQISLREREIEIELSHLIGQIQDRHSADLLLELHRFHLSPQVSAEEEARLKEVRAQIERMGEINVTAIEEHAEVLQRCEFLRKERKDLEDSIRNLNGAIARINRTSRERFQQTFDVINEKFQQVFPRMFGGGRAGLVLTEEAEGLEQGVEIVAQPPGKKLQNINLLSGGEKALTAVSLVFSIFLIRPTPFCLLDEVDAPLDEANVGRYNDLVREMSKQSQFILITHNKRTMEIADTLYGVTMEEAGVSKLVAVQLREALAANSDQAA
jgi:chromosome segregation protein